jgi:hypothetical protein
MKRLKTILFVTIYGAGLTFFMYCNRQKQTFKTDRADFKAGEIVGPDYAHDDTLIVVDADKLNTAIYNCEGTDGEIDSILHLYCKSYKK